LSCNTVACTCHVGCCVSAVEFCCYTSSCMVSAMRSGCLLKTMSIKSKSMSRLHYRCPLHAEHQNSRQCCLESLTGPMKPEKLSQSMHIPFWNNALCPRWMSPLSPQIVDSHHLQILYRAAATLQQAVLPVHSSLLVLTACKDCSLLLRHVPQHS